MISTGIIFHLERTSLKILNLIRLSTNVFLLFFSWIDKMAHFNRKKMQIEMLIKFDFQIKRLLLLFMRIEAKPVYTQKLLCNHHVEYVYNDVDHDFKSNLIYLYTHWMRAKKTFHLAIGCGKTTMHIMNKISSKLKHERRRRFQQINDADLS